MNPRLRTFLVWAGLLAVLLAILALTRGDDDLPYRSYETLGADVTAETIAAVEVDGRDLIVRPDTGSAYRVKDAASDEVTDWLWENGVEVGVQDESSGGLLSIVVLAAGVVVGLYLLRRYQQRREGGGQPTIFDMRKSKARKLAPGAEKTRFSDVGGHAEAKEMLSDVVAFLRDPKQWTDAGIPLPRGVLLEGPPGGGKTLLARAVAGEAGVPVFVISASEFVEMFIGVGAARIRDLFDTARKVAPAVIFIDEIDAVGRRRGSGLGSSHDEREQTLNQLLVCLDGFEPATKLVVIAATNRSDVLDRALLRPGRFGMRLVLGSPDLDARTVILGIHCRNKTLAPGLDLRSVAERAPGASGAMLEQLCNEAGLRAVRRSRKDGTATLITPEDFTAALEAAAKTERTFDALDALFVESTSQLSQPTGDVYARLTLTDTSVIEGRIVWADASYVKIEPRAADTGAAPPPRLVPKAQIAAAEALAGTSLATEVRPDLWASNRTGTA
ncbi:MAG: AAA family ATPase [Pseudomonadota bacterium]|nr:AAA family ATPase [Pseudomonadota bacterium]